MQKRKKGFTIVELVIVIAVIAILAAVLIPTFANVIKKANESVVVQNVRNMNTVLASSPEEMEKHYNDVIDREKAGSSEESFNTKFSKMADEFRAEAAYLTIKDQGYDIAMINVKTENQYIVFYVPDECFCVVSYVDDEFVFGFPYSGAFDDVETETAMKNCVLFLNDNMADEYWVYFSGSTYYIAD